MASYTIPGNIAVSQRTPSQNNEAAKTPAKYDLTAIRFQVLKHNPFAKLTVR